MYVYMHMYIYIYFVCACRYQLPNSPPRPIAHILSPQRSATGEVAPGNWGLPWHFAGRTSHGSSVPDANQAIGLEHGLDQVRRFRLGKS